MRLTEKGFQNQDDVIEAIGAHNKIKTEKNSAFNSRIKKHQIFGKQIK
ncbi:MAG: hypothetical protein M3162_00275 [Thermoproteota archaeon]|nr:hypothetical protein [Thermoproteota archaeon]